MLRRQIITCLLLLAALSTIHCDVYQSKEVWKPLDNRRLVVSENNRFLQYENGRPFFWLGDTAWLLFKNLDRAELRVYQVDLMRFYLSERNLDRMTRIDLAGIDPEVHRTLELKKAFISLRMVGRTGCLPVCQIYLLCP